jgi:hypothetical protein
MAENSKLKEVSKTFRNNLLTPNRYRESINEYNEQNKDTISDGDNKGRESVGNSLDIEKRTLLIQKNDYNSNNPYSIID